LGACETCMDGIDVEEWLTRPQFSLQTIE
jgi:hypothetical protein